MVYTRAIQLHKRSSSCVFRVARVHILLSEYSGLVLVGELQVSVVEMLTVLFPLICCVLQRMCKLIAIQWFFQMVLRKDVKAMVYKAICITTLLYSTLDTLLYSTLRERGVGYLSMSPEDRGDIPLILSQKDSLSLMGGSPHQCQCPHGGQHN